MILLKLFKILLVFLLVGLAAAAPTNVSPHPCPFECEAAIVNCLHLNSAKLCHEFVCKDLHEQCCECLACQPSANSTITPKPANTIAADSGNTVKRETPPDTAPKTCILICRLHNGCTYLCFPPGAPLPDDLDGATVFYEPNLGNKTISFKAKRELEGESLVGPACPHWNCNIHGCWWQVCSADADTQDSQNGALSNKRGIDFDYHHTKEVAASIKRDVDQNDTEKPPCKWRLECVTKNWCWYECMNGDDTQDVDSNNNAVLGAEKRNVDQDDKKKPKPQSTCQPHWVCFGNWCMAQCDSDAGAGEIDSNVSNTTTNIDKREPSLLPRMDCSTHCVCAVCYTSCTIDNEPVNNAEKRSLAPSAEYCNKTCSEAPSETMCLLLCGPHALPTGQLQKRIETICPGNDVDGTAA